MTDYVKIKDLYSKIIDIYSIFQQAFHGNFVKYCEVANIAHRHYKPGVCNCITEDCAQGIAIECYNKVFGTYEYQCPSTFNCTPKFSLGNKKQLTAEALNEISEIIEQLYKANVSIHEDDKINQCIHDEIPKKILIIICFAALTGNYNIKNPKDRSVGLYKAFDLLFLSDEEMSNRLQVFTTSNESNVNRTIDSLTMDSESKKVLKTINECCKRIQSIINVGGDPNINVTGYYSFDESLFMIYRPLLTKYECKKIFTLGESSESSS